MGIKLSQIDDENLTDEQIDNIVYSDIENDGLSSEYGFVFGNSMLINERVNTSVDAYKKDRVKKLIFMGGVNGVSNQDNSTISEAKKMKELAISLGVNEEDILIDDTSNNTFENIENAIKKARGYYEKTKISTIAGDSGLFIDGIPNDKQPGLFVRRVNGKVLSDDEMIEYYTKLIESIGGKGTAYYVTGLALITEQKLFTTEIIEDKFILSSTTSNKNHRGNPLDVMTIDPVSQKFYTDMTDEDFLSLGHNFDKECVKFLEKNLLNNSKKFQKIKSFSDYIS